MYLSQGRFEENEWFPKEANLDMSKKITIAKVLVRDFKIGKSNYHAVWFTMIDIESLDYKQIVKVHVICDKDELV